jgi:hypothetical protein
VAQSDCRKSRRPWPLLEKGQELELCGDAAAGGDNGMGLRASYVGLSLASPSVFVFQPRRDLPFWGTCVTLARHSAATHCTQSARPHKSNL